jgi:DNA-binding transcriptional regulator LsrR (DeoR family)
MGGTDVRSFIGAAAARYVAECLPPSGSLGITWGGTINAAAQNLPQRSGDGTRVVLMSGGLAESAPINPYDNATDDCPGARRAMLLSDRADVRRDCGAEGHPGRE